MVAGREALLRLADDRDDGVRRRARRRHGQERVAREHDVAVARRRARREPVDLALLHPRLHGRRERARRPRRGRQADGAGPLGDVDELVAAAEFAHGVRQRRARGLGHAQHEHGAGPSPRAAVERVDGAADGLAQRGRRRFHAGLLVVERAHEGHADEDEQSEAPARDEELRRRAARRARRADLLRVRRQALAFARDATHRAVKARVVWSRPKSAAAAQLDVAHDASAAAQLDVAHSAVAQPNSREVRLTMLAHRVLRLGLCFLEFKICSRSMQAREKRRPMVILRPQKVTNFGALHVCGCGIRREEQRTTRCSPFRDVPWNSSLEAGRLRCRNPAQSLRSAISTNPV